MKVAECGLSVGDKVKLVEPVYYGGNIVRAKLLR